MIKLQYLGSSPLDVEISSLVKTKTFEGALHLKPKKVYTLSKEEYAELKKLYPELKFLVFGENKKFERKVKVIPKKVKVKPRNEDDKSSKDKEKKK